MRSTFRSLESSLEGQAITLNSRARGEVHCGEAVRVLSEGLTNTAGATRGNHTMQSGLAGGPGLLLGCGLWSRGLVGNYLVICHKTNVCQDGIKLTKVGWRSRSHSPVFTTSDDILRSHGSGVSAGSHNSLIDLRYAF